MITWNRVEERRAEPRRGGMGPNRGKVNYREVLIPEDFAVFAHSQGEAGIAQADAVPVYTIFTNEQLAQMVQARATTKAAPWSRSRASGTRRIREVQPQDAGGPPHPVGPGRQPLKHIAT